jgi:hypothetical protein
VFKEKQKTYSPYQERQKRQARKQRLQEWGAIATAATALLGGAGKAYAGDWLMIPRAGVDRVLHDQAPNVPDAEVQRIVSLLNQPQNPELTQLHKKVEKLPKDQGTAFDQELHNFYNQQAKKYGLHLANIPSYNSRLKEAKNIDEILSITNELTHQYGFSVSIPEHTGIKDLGEGVHTLNRQKVSLNDIRWSAECIVNGLELIPLEVGKHLHLKTFDIVDSLHPFMGSEAGGLHNSATHVNYIDFVGNDGDVNAVEHEMGHEIDEDTVGEYGMNNDPSFSRYNPKGFRYKAGQIYWTPDGSYGKNPAIVEDQGSRNVEEDKATYYNFIFDSWKPGMRGSIMKEKLAVLLARLDKLAPGYAEFYGSTSFKK